MSLPNGILSIEKVYLDEDGDIVVEAVIENMGKITSPQTLYDMAEYAPGLCRTHVYKENVPPGIEIEDKEEDLKGIIDRYNLLVHQEWESVDVDDSDKCLDDYTPSESRMFF
jgi:hypothetical protein